MLSYLHSFHAGNHADILKHSVLLFILDGLKNKEKPFSVFDTHAASGLYSLTDEKSQKTKEAEKGILTLYEYVRKNPCKDTSLLGKYISFCKPFLEKNLYPGSPLFEASFTGSDCFHVLSELHGAEFEKLKNNFMSSECREFTDLKLIPQILNRNGFEALNALTPPKIKRGLVLIDPSYEETSDYENCARTICTIHRKWSAAIICLWYPLLLHRKNEIALMKTKIIQSAKQANPNTEILDAQLLVNTEDSHTETSLEENSGPPRLYGSGMLVINTPWKLEENMREFLSDVEKIIYQEDGNPSFRIELI